MPTGEKFLHGNKAYGEVKIGNKVKKFANKNADPDAHNLIPQAKVKNGIKQWKFSSKNKVDYKPGVKLHKPIAMSPLGDPPLTLSSMAEEGLSNGGYFPAMPAADCADIAKKESKGSDIDIGMAPLPPRPKTPTYQFDTSKFETFDPLPRHLRRPVSFAPATPPINVAHRQCKAPEVVQGEQGVAPQKSRANVP